MMVNMIRTFHLGLKIIPVALLCLLFPSVTTKAQEMLGIQNGNYAGVNGSLINPANMGYSRQFLNVNLLGGDFFINSNYIYIHRRDYNFLRLFSVDINDPQYIYIYQYPEYQFADTLHFFDYKKNTDLKRVYANARILGPSLMVHYGNHAFSLITGFRNNVSVDKMTYNTANFIFRGLDFVPQQDVTYAEGPYQVCILSWMEVGLGYAYTFFSDQNRDITAGVTVKGLLGTGGAYAALKDVTYNVPNSDSIVFDKLNCTFGFALPMDYSGGTSVSLDPLIKGTGWSVDFGINWVQKAGRTSGNVIKNGKGSGPEENYRFRVGLSILDIGKISFNQNVQVHEFNDVTNEIWPGLRSFHATSIQQFMRSASYNLLGDSLASLSAKTTFSIWLPTALSLQVDYNFGYNIYANATFVQGIRLGNPGVRRATLLSITPRYETPVWEVNLPLSLVDFRDPQIGLAFRIYSLTIGTEKLGTFFNLTDVRGLDLYFALGFNLSRGSKDWKYKRPKTGPCDSYENYDRYRTRNR
jgi:hypothetical protein